MTRSNPAKPPSAEKVKLVRDMSAGELWKGYVRFLFTAGVLKDENGKPLTRAPREASHAHNHPPTKPVWPVTSTRRPRHQAALGAAGIACFSARARRRAPRSG